MNLKKYCTNGIAKLRKKRQSSKYSSVVGWLQARRRDKNCVEGGFILYGGGKWLFLWIIPYVFCFTFHLYAL